MGMDIEKLLAQIEAAPTSASVRTAFGEPIRVDNRLIVPVAKVGGWFGLGFGRGESGREQPGQGAAGQGAGGGGGARLSVRPLAVIEITPEKVQVLPIIDLTRLATLGLLLVAWNVFWITRTIRAVRASRRE